MYCRYSLALAARSRWRPFLPTLSVVELSRRPPDLGCCSGSPPNFAVSRMQYASRGKGGRGAPNKYDEDEDEDDDDDDDAYEFDEVEDNSGYEWDYETWNLLHQGRKKGELSRKWPLPMYKAREMVDYHMIKNRLDGLQVILDPKLEYETRKKLHEGLVEFYKKRQEAFDEIDAKHEESLKELESGDKKEALPTAEGDDAKTVPMDDQSSDEESLQVDGKVTEGVSSSEVKPDVEFDTEKIVVETVSAEKESHEKEDNAEMRDLSGVTTAVDEIMRDVLSTPEITTLDLRKADAETKNDAESEGKEESLELKNETSEDDGINVFDYDKWVAYKEQEMAKRYAAEEERKHATLRWKIQLVLGPGDVVHPANRKASVSVYVRELCLSKYAKKRLLALVGRRYNAPKDELTIVSERYPHRYENQKDVLRLLLALIEEARKADELVYNARVAFLESKHTDLKETVAAA